MSKQYQIQWGGWNIYREPSPSTTPSHLKYFNNESKCQKHFYVTHWYKIFLTFLLTSLSLYIFTIWKSIVYHRLCRDGIYFDKILVSEYKLFKRSNKANLFITTCSIKNFFPRHWLLAYVTKISLLKSW